MKTVSSVREMRRFCERARLQKKSIGLVPTMGYLHEGHMSLIRRAAASCDVVVTSIFVNPTQFAPGEDFSTYPRDIERDKRLCRSAGTTVLFTPAAHAIYPEGFSTYVGVEGLSSVLEGKFRPTHFRGVATVVAKLFLITLPDKAYFGQKDAQQCLIVERMVRDLNFGIEIVVAPIVREKDGLAMSSRNTYLGANEREDALVLSASLKRAEILVKQGERKPASIVTELTQMIQTKPTATIDYVAVVHGRTLVDLEEIKPGVPAMVALAVRFGKTRLIDNTIITLH